LKRTGGATLATALALHGSRVQVQAAATGAWQVASEGGTSSTETCTGTNFEEENQIYRWKRVQVITYTPIVTNPEQLSWGSSATANIIVTVTVTKQRLNSNQTWEDTGTSVAASYQRSKTATIHTDTGVLTFSHDSQQSADNSQNGVKITIKPLDDPPVTVEGPSGSGLTSDTMQANFNFKIKRLP
jgi:hypothetical protein